MFGIVIFAAAGLAALWGSRTAIGLAIGGEVMRGQLYKRETKRAFELDLNPGRGGTQGFGVVEITAEEIPPSYAKFVGKYICSKQEATLFLAALQDLINGTGEIAAGYDFVWMQGIQEKRRNDSQFGKLLQN